MSVLYRKYRPEKFDDVVGQSNVTEALKNQIIKGRIGHAYLFTGSRGTGKTTCAKIFARAINCLSPVNGSPCGKCEACRELKSADCVDIIEMDAASNNGVDEIREIREKVKYAPAVAKKKVYIIDEVHMLSTGAFNALLKTLEEPPENVVFILATTEPQKLPATILSRCLRLDFKRVPQKLLMEGMRRICEEKGVTLTESALKLLANCADGSVRDGLSVLDQVLASGQKEIDREAVLEYIGAAGEDFFIELTEQEESLQIGPYMIDAYRVNHKVICYGYSIRIPRKGRFDVDRAREQMIPQKFWSRLQKGEIIEEDGRTFTPDMVLGTERKGLKVTYSTDTRPTESIRQNAQGADLLILEGMYGEPDKLVKAREHKHMTMYEAAKIAKEVGAPKLWLTHYSPSMTRPEEFMDDVRKIFPAAYAAKDGWTMELNFDEGK